MGQNYLYVSGTQQSGPWEDKIWTHTLGNLHKLGTNLHKYEKILILGLGTGNLATLINNKFPNTNIIGVEIDPEVIDIGKKYFGLKNLSNLKIVIADAFDFIKKGKTKYDLIFIDLFVGENSPKKIESTNFLKNLSQTVSKDGVIVFNRLTTKTANFELENFVDKLSKFLKIEKEVKIDFNNIFYCSRKE